MVLSSLGGASAQSKLGAINPPQPSEDGARTRRGAYGVAVTGLAAEERLLVVGQSHWPTVRICVDPRAADARGALLEKDMARYPDAREGHVTLDRQAGVASFTGANGLTTDEIVH